MAILLALAIAPMAAASSFAVMVLLVIPAGMFIARQNVIATWAKSRQTP